MNKKYLYFIIPALLILSITIFMGIQTSADDKAGVSAGKIVGVSLDRSKSLKEQNPELNELNINRLKSSAATLIEKGFSEEEAIEEAFNAIITHAAIMEEAEKRGIKVTDEEAYEKAQETRAFIEEVRDNPEYQEVIKVTENFWKSAGMTEEEYWEEYIINSYKFQLTNQKLFDLVTKDIEPMENQQYWREFLDKITSEYISNNKEKVEEFRKEADSLDLL